jgi:hypothetical protein
MADDPENHTLRLLREMREENQQFREETARRFDALEATAAARHTELSVEIAAMRADQHRTNEILEKVAKTQRNHGARLNAIDGRLAVIEEHTGLVKV